MGLRNQNRQYRTRALLPETYLAAARSRWSIEYVLHWGLDMVFDEDQKTAAARTTHRKTLQSCENSPSTSYDVDS